MSTKIHSYRWFCGQHRKIKFFTTSHAKLGSYLIFKDRMHFAVELSTYTERTYLYK